MFTASTAFALASKQVNDAPTENMAVRGGGLTSNGTHLLLNRLSQITEKDFPQEKITGADRTVEEVVEIFNRVNSGGTLNRPGSAGLGARRVRAVQWGNASTWLTQPIQGFESPSHPGRSLDLAVEALVLRPEYAPLFTAEERGRARARLEQFGHRFLDE